MAKLAPDVLRRLAKGFASERQEATEIYGNMEWWMKSIYLIHIYIYIYQYRSIDIMVCNHIVYSIHVIQYIIQTHLIYVLICMYVVNFGCLQSSVLTVSVWTMCFMCCSIHWYVHICFTFLPTRFRRYGPMAGFRRCWSIFHGVLNTTTLCYQLTSGSCSQCCTRLFHEQQDENVPSLKPT